MSGDGEIFTLLLYESSPESKPDIYTVIGNSIEISGLMGNTVYYWSVSSGNGTSEIFSFKTADSPRTVYIDGVTNSRDIGGLKTEDGYRIRQGIVYRAALLDGITESGIEYCSNILKIKTELDLRKNDAGKTGSSPIGNSVRYVNIPGGCYVSTYDIFGDEYRQVMHDIFMLFTDENNFPILFHCSAGRDRTGSLAFILEALCGVGDDDIYHEYDLSFFSANGGHEPSVMHKNFFLPMILKFNKYQRNSNSEKAKSYLLELGLTEMEIELIRNNLLEK